MVVFIIRGSNKALPGTAVPLENALERWICLESSSAETGDVQAQYNLAQKYDLGLGVHRDNAEAANWYRKAAEQDYEPAQFALAMAYHEGEGVPKDMQHAANWFEKASNLGHAESSYYLAQMYLQGNLGHGADAHRASLPIYQKAA